MVLFSIQDICVYKILRERVTHVVVEQFIVHSYTCARYSDNRVIYIFSLFAKGEIGSDGYETGLGQFEKIQKLKVIWSELLKGYHIPILSFFMNTLPFSYSVWIVI